MGIISESYFKFSMVLFIGLVLSCCAPVNKNIRVSKEEMKTEFSDVTKVLSSARAVPVFSKEGQGMGFKLSSIAEGSYFTRLGLQQGDVVQAINGRSLTSPSRAMEIFNLLKNRPMSKYVLSVLRDQKKIKITIKVM